MSMKTISYESFPDLLRSEVPGFDRIYDEHVRYYEEVLPHVLLGELVRFLCTNDQTGTVRTKAVALLELAMESDDPRISELIAVSFLENLDPQEDVSHSITKLFGPRLREQFEITWADSELGPIDD